MGYYYYENYYDKPTAYIFTILGTLFTFLMVVSSFPLIPRLWRGNKIPSMVLYSNIALITHCSFSAYYYLSGLINDESMPESYYWSTAVHFFGIIMALIFVLIAIGRVKAYRTKLIVGCFIASITVSSLASFIFLTEDSNGDNGGYGFLIIQNITQFIYFSIPFAFLHRMRKEKKLCDFYLPIPVTQFMYCALFFNNSLFYSFDSFYSNIISLVIPFILMIFYLVMRVVHGPSVFVKIVKMEDFNAPNAQLELIQIVNGDKIEYARVQRVYDISLFKIRSPLPTFVQCAPTTTVGADTSQQKFMEP
ncbi:hypothetical protein CYY_005341 [Polysphondylium violaceum]|uniref:Uncharacterized protein n=1 Tax=Polysphondylium violaceum TaxID=133409 RepID=A0A8J4UYP9_9MYCE|nr:hypothetical protein CYY_005341 [Polysphondylium violaceum]